MRAEMRAERVEYPRDACTRPEEHHVFPEVVDGLDVADV
jgi:hypothetical protein